MKNLAAEHEKIMKELIEEHAQAREMVGKLAGAGEIFRRGDSAKLTDIGVILEGLSRLYPRHIEKEDKHFFFPVMEYFSKEEQDAMLREFWEFDRNMIHEKYRKLVDGLEV
jgi:hemerythrin-like domain-containing protein